METLNNMHPNGYARTWLYEHVGPFTLEIDDEDWCRVKKDGKQVWECNGVFARKHFYKTNFD